MLELIAHNLAPIMFVSVMGLLLLGYPVALTLSAGGLFFFVIGVALSDYSSEINLFWPLLQAMPERVFGIMSNDTLLAIPFFTFMGIILERSGMAEDLLDTIGQLFGPLRGGVAFAVIFVGALLAATTGVVAASVIAMGLISLPVMQRYSYNRPVATGTIAAAGTLAQIVPPSLVLIVMADQLGVSVGDMYLGAIWPALIIIASYCAYILVLTIIRPDAVPALPMSERRLGTGVWSLVAMAVLAVALYLLGSRVVFADSVPATATVFSATLATVVCYAVALANRTFKLGLLSRLAETVVIVMIPPLALIFLVLGTIFLGIATPTEGGAMGAVGALALAFGKRRLDFPLLRSAIESTAKLSAFVLFILIGARVFGLTFYGVNGQVWLEELLLALPGGQIGFLIVVTIVIFILGCFLDFFEIAFILVPLLAPVAQTLGIDLIWFGVILSMNLQTSFLTPPFGFALFYLRSVAPSREWTDKQTGRRMEAIRTYDIYKGVVPFIVIQFVLILLVIAVPSLVTHYRGDRQPIQVETPGSATGGLNFGLGGGAATGGAAPGGAVPGGGDAGFNFGPASSGGASGTSGTSGGGAATGGTGGFNFGAPAGGTQPSQGQGSAAPGTGEAPAAGAGGATGGFNFGTPTAPAQPAQPGSGSGSGANAGGGAGATNDGTTGDASTGGGSGSGNGATGGFNF
ncbi:C4-dicarboxylate ABC transporter [Fulvimarina endophytica]|uniref:C4-dicarboxylate ABC transporter n=1 Tax=Fulvimarina endophytica TaxID=2293836 RepID=A0A371X4G5_9HYPH|nr:TRAP transporter large permease subunit [Fulvimarina endophytica]RFC64121.1 C4-dicarboxylate ABC transporter [Fulvimarina endophytica]